MSEGSDLLETVRIAIATSLRLRRTAEEVIAETNTLLRALRELKRPHGSIHPSPSAVAEPHRQSDEDEHAAVEDRLSDVEPPRIALGEMAIDDPSQH